MGLSSPGAARAGAPGGARVPRRPRQPQGRHGQPQAHPGAAPACACAARRPARSSARRAPAGALHRARAAPEARAPPTLTLHPAAQELQEEVDSAREAWLRKQRSARDRASKEGREVTGAGRLVHRALKAADAARKAVAEAELDLSEAQYNVQRCARALRLPAAEYTGFRGPCWGPLRCIRAAHTWGSTRPAWTAVLHPSCRYIKGCGASTRHGPCGVRGPCSGRPHRARSTA